MSQLSKQEIQYLHAMGVQVWQNQSLEQQKNAQSSGSQSASIPAGSHQAVKSTSSVKKVDIAERPDVSQLDWASLRKTVESCRLCELCESRTQTVFGVGQHQADWMIVGEAPGAEEDRKGEPFVGRAGQLLDQMLASLGLDRQAVYIANVLKCRPPGNRDPKIEEAHLCSAYLDQQISLVKPKLIVAVGRVAAQRLLDTKDSLARMRGRLHHYSETNIPMIVTYHPAYLLRSPGQKRKAWEDLLLGAQQFKEESK